MQKMPQPTYTIFKDTKAQGPYDLGQVLEMARRGALKPDDFVVEVEEGKTPRSLQTKQLFFPGASENLPRLANPENNQQPSVPNAPSPGIRRHRTGSLNREQKAIMIVGLALFIVSCLFSPWEITNRAGAVWREYAPIFKPPSTSARLNLRWPELAVEWSSIAVVMGVLLVFARGQDSARRRAIFSATMLIIVSGIASYAAVCIDIQYTRKAEKAEIESQDRHPATSLITEYRKQNPDDKRSDSELTFLIGQALSPQAFEANPDFARDYQNISAELALATESPLEHYWGRSMARPIVVAVLGLVLPWLFWATARRFIRPLDR
jgi:hypothetical protein